MKSRRGGDGINPWHEQSESSSLPKPLYGGTSFARGALLPSLYAMGDISATEQNKNIKITI